MKNIPQPEFKQLIGKYVDDTQKAGNDVAELKKYYANIVFPEYLPQTFDDVIGMENEKENFQDALKFLGNIEEYQKEPDLSPNTRYLLAGPQGAGKSIIVDALAKTAGVPLISVSTATFCAFPKKLQKILDLIFRIASSMKHGCVILFDDYDAIKKLTASDQMLFQNHFIQSVEGDLSSIIILSTTDPSYELPDAYQESDAFCHYKDIFMQAPTLKTREALIKKYFTKYKLNLADDVSAERLAKNTLGDYPKDIEDMIRETMLYVGRKGLDVVTAKDFNEVMLTMIAGEQHNKLNEKERISTAYHEAGHVIAAYYTNPDYILGRVEITPRAASLGLTQEESGEEKYCLFKHEYEYEIIYSFGGMAAEKIIYGETTSGVSGDLSSANGTASLMYKELGMSDEIGPIIIDSDFGSVSQKLLDQADLFIQSELKRLLQKTIDVVSEHRPQLEALTQALLEHEVLMGNEIKAVLDKADIEQGLTPKQNNNTISNS